MKKIIIFILLASSIIYTSCQNSKEKPANIPDESNVIGNDDNITQEARENMLDWQIRKVYDEYNGTFHEENTLPISDSQAEIYLSQKDLLKSNTDYTKKWGLDFSAKESKKETLLLDKLHEHLSYWMLMRENMRVLYTTEENGEYYSLVLTTGYDFVDGIYLVHHKTSGKNLRILDVLETPDNFSLQNVYLGVVDQNSPICFGFAKKLKYDSDKDTWVDSDISKILLSTTATEQEIEVNIAKPFIVFLENGVQITGYKALNQEGTVIEEKELTELDFALP